MRQTVQHTWRLIRSRLCLQPTKVGKKQNNDLIRRHVHWKVCPTGWSP